MRKILRPYPPGQKRGIMFYLSIVEQLIMLMVVAAIITFLFNTSSCNRKYISIRQKAVKEIKPLIQEVSPKYAKDFNCDIKEVEIVISLIMLSETSAEGKDGNWYPMTSPLVEYHNILGFKASKKKLGDGKYTNKPTWEEIDGKKVNMKDNFAKFGSKKECIEYWFKLITSKEPLIVYVGKGKNKKKKVLPPRYQKVCEATNYAEILIQLQVCGYMTDSKYPQKMLNICKDNKIYELWD